MKTCRLLLLPGLISMILLMGCSGVPFWLNGDWIYDADRSQQEAAKASPAQPGDMLGGIKTMLQNMIAPQLQGMEIMFTGTDEIVTVRGQGTSTKYQVIHKSATTCTIKKPDNTIETYYRDGDEIYSFGSGGLSTYKIYFRRNTPK